MLTIISLILLNTFMYFTISNSLIYRKEIKCNNYYCNKQFKLIKTITTRLSSTNENNDNQEKSSVKKRSLSSLLKKISSLKTEEASDTIIIKEKKNVERSDNNNKPKSFDLPDEFKDFGKRKITSIYKRRDQINVSVVGFGRLGVSVQVINNNNKKQEEEEEGKEEDITTGLILTHEVDYWKGLNNRDLRIGDTITAFVQNVRDDGKLDIAIRPIGYDKVTESKERMLSFLSSTSVLPLGDKSSPESIWELFPGISKSQFKLAVGLLLREGVITTSPDRIELVPEVDRKPMQALPWSGKSPKGWRAPDDCTLFVGNVAFDVDDLTLAKSVEAVIGFGKVASVKISIDADTGKSRGFAHIDFFQQTDAEEGLQKLEELAVGGRNIHLERKKRASEVVKSNSEFNNFNRNKLANSNNVDNSDNNNKYNRNSNNNENSKPLVREDRPAKGTVEYRPTTATTSAEESWCTVYAGDLPYKVTDESLRQLVESSLTKGKGAVAAIRQAVNKETGLKRGFGYIDFINMETAERAVKELNGMNIMGRAIKLELEGPKKRGRKF